MSFFSWLFFSILAPQTPQITFSSSPANSECNDSIWQPLAGVIGPPKAHHLSGAPMSEFAFQIQTQKRDLDLRQRPNSQHTFCPISRERPPWPVMQEDAARTGVRQAALGRLLLAGNELAPVVGRGKHRAAEDGDAADDLDETGDMAQKHQAQHHGPS